MNKFIYLFIFVFIISGMFLSVPVDAQEGVPVFRERVYPVGYGRVISVDSFNHVVDYNGSELILTLTFYNNETVAYTDIVGNMTMYEIFSGYDTAMGITSFVYHIGFISDGSVSYIMYLGSGSSERVLFNVTGSNFEYIDSDLLDKYELEWAYGQGEMAEISEIMNAYYPDTPAGHHNAVLDVIDDSRALRQGPVLFGYQMAFGLIVMFASPFSILWIIIILVLFISSKRKESDILKRLDKERGDLDIDTEELAVASRIVKARSMATLASIKNIAPHLGVSAIIWRDIHKRFTTIASLLAAFDDSEFMDDGRIKGPIADALTTWIRNSLTLEQRSRLEGTYRAPTVEDYVKALKRILQYVSSNLHLPNYEQYIHSLDASDKWISEIIKDLQPGGSGVFETRDNVGRPDFSSMIDGVR